MSARALAGWVRAGVASVAGVGVKLGAGALLPWRFGGGVEREGPDENHLHAALTWLCLAQDACAGRGVAAMYTLGEGFAHAYPETSGYLIATFLARARSSDAEPGLRARAIRLGDWELEIQTPGGGVLSSLASPATRVFNTGQVILGLCALEDELKQGRHLVGAERAGRYLMGLQENDGRWERDTYCGARTYHARVDWGLMRLSRLTGDRSFAEAAARNLAWVLAQAQPDGWFERCGFNADAPITHVIAYTLRGLLECHALADPALQGLELLAPVQAAAEGLLRAINTSSLEGIPGLLPASFDPGWISRDRYSCLTGNAQLSLVFARLGHLTGHSRYWGAARSLASAAKRTQRMRERAPEVHGAVAGSHPLGGRYCAYAFPNWAPKFLADALLFQQHQHDPGFNILA